MTVNALSTATDPTRNKARSLWVACGAHALHDGFTDTLYVLLPIWQAQFVS
jgi:MFS transporter, FSR family, fosmidomycin resistance protein